MTNLIDNNLQQPEKTPPSMILELIKKLIGYELWAEYYVVRTVFKDQDTEIVFVNNILMTHITIYVNGEIKVSRFPLCSEIKTDTTFTYNGIEYRLYSRCANVLTMAQKVVLYRDGQEISQKRVPRLELLNWSQVFYMTLGALAFGFSITYFLRNVI